VVTAFLRNAVFVLLAIALSLGTVSAQRAIPLTPVAAPQAGAPVPAGKAPAQPAAPAQAGAPAQPAAAAPPAPPENYTYQPEGRRDPFLNLLGQGAEPRAGRRADGAAGLTVAEVAVKGIVESRGALLAMIQGPDNKTYIVRQGDRLVDGTVRSVTPQGLIIVQEVNDPLSLVKQREIYKLLRSQEGAKE
jgi:Tfp pilus assembly protein PilP